MNLESYLKKIVDISKENTGISDYTSQVQVPPPSQNFTRQIKSSDILSKNKSNPPPKALVFAWLEMTSNSTPPEEQEMEQALQPKKKKDIEKRSENSDPPSRSVMPPQLKSQQEKLPVKRVTGFYNPDEDFKIVKYVINNKLEYRVNGNEIWKDAEEENIVPGRTWQSIRSRFICLRKKRFARVTLLTGLEKIKLLKKLEGLSPTSSKLKATNIDEDTDDELPATDDELPTTDDELAATTSKTDKRIDEDRQGNCPTALKTMNRSLNTPKKDFNNKINPPTTFKNRSPLDTDDCSETDFEVHINRGKDFNNRVTTQSSSKVNKEPNKVNTRTSPSSNYSDVKKIMKNIADSYEKAKNNFSSENVYKNFFEEISPLIRRYQNIENPAEGCTNNRNEDIIAVSSDEETSPSLVPIKRKVQKRKLFNLNKCDF